MCWSFQKPEFLGTSYTTGNLTSLFNDSANTDIYTDAEISEEGLDRVLPGADPLPTSFDDVPAWWAQMVTVGYERIRGLREIGQRRGGAFEANKSKTFPVPVDRLYRAFAQKRTRRRWLPDDVTIRTSKREKSICQTSPFSGGSDRFPARPVMPSQGKASSTVHPRSTSEASFSVPCT